MDNNNEKKRTGASTLLWALLVIVAVAGVIAFARSRSAEENAENGNVGFNSPNSATGGDDTLGATASPTPIPTDQLTPTPGPSDTVTPTPIPSTNSTGVTSPVASPSVKEFTISASNYKYDVSNISVNKGDTVRIILKDTEGTHDLVVDGYNVSTKVLNAGEQDVIEFTADKPGQFEYYCSIGQHRQMGMVGTLTVL